MPGTFPSGVVTFLFTDIEGSTKLWERCPDVMRDALSDHDRILRDAVTANEGVVFKAVGDAFCCAFAVPEKAVRASIDAQRSLQGRQWPGDLGGLRVRAGIHSGGAVQRDDDYFGPTLNRTARLMSIAHGEQILVSAATEALLRDVLTADVSLRDLGTHRLKDLSRPENAYQVVAPGIRTEFPALNTLDSRPNNLPSQASSFVGRETELAELCELVRERRVVTITGPGGMGKTRTSLQVAAALLDEYPDGAWFVDLSGLKDASLVAQSIGAALGIGELPNATMRATLLEELREKRLLLVIDNAEHLIAEVTAVVGDLVARCPGMSLLVTSREPLHVAGEQVYRLAPMSSAPDDAELAALAEHDATRLFLERARETAPKLSPSAADVTAIVSLCRRLEGIPLAIELAAARVGLLSVQQLDQRLAEGLAVLAARGAAGDRHRTLEATIDWSYQLLDDEEKRLFECVSIFSDGFTLEACEAIAPAASLSAPALDVLQSLVDKSLVTAATNGHTRFTMLEAIHEYAGSHRKSRGAYTPLPASHFTFYLALANQYQDGGDAAARSEWIEAVSVDISNCRSALEWSLGAKDGRAGELLCGLAVFWQSTGRLTEGRAWLDLYLRRRRSGDALYPRVLRFAAFFAASRDDHDAALRLTSRLLRLARRRGDALMEGEALHTKAAIEQRRGNAAKALSLFSKALELFERSQSDRSALVAILNITNALMASDDFSRCRPLLERAARLAVRVADDELTAVLLGLRGSLALQEADLDVAAQQISEALSLQKAAGSSRRIEDLNSLAEVRAKQGRLDDARGLVAESLSLSLPLDEHNNVIRSFEVSAYIAGRDGRDEDALTLLSMARALRQNHAYYTQTFFGMEDLEAALRARLGDGYRLIPKEDALPRWRAVAQSLLDLKSDYSNFTNT